MLAAISDDMPTMAIDRPLPDRPTLPSTAKFSFFSKKQGKAPAASNQSYTARPPVVVDVQLDEANFRAETEFGLYETLRCRALLVTVDVR